MLNYSIYYGKKMVNEIIIETRFLSKIYKMSRMKIKVLNNISMEIKKGDFIAIIGPSGSGKTTLLNILGCLDRPTSGILFFKGKKISELNENYLTEIRKNEIGFIFQSFNLIPTLSAISNVTLPMTFKGLPKYIRIERAKSILNNLGLKDLSNHYPHELSAGEQQRIAIARALANNPEIILADEPTGNLDTTAGKQIMNILSSLNDEKKTIILVTHDLSLTKYSNKVIEIVDGKIEKSEYK
jgi:putative ABC transport system ATP-binding protein